jgi:hypothetical protein
MQCFHCDRQVQATIHRQTSYQVDYYLFHTGRTHWEILANPKSDPPSFRYLRLTEPTDIITCVQCYALPEIRRRLDDDFAGRSSLLDFCSSKAASPTEPNPKG